MRAWASWQLMAWCIAVSSVRPGGQCLPRMRLIDISVPVSGFACPWQSPANPLSPLCQ